MKVSIMGRRILPTTYIETPFFTYIHGLVCYPLELDRLGGPHDTVAGDEHTGLGILNATCVTYRTSVMQIQCR